MIKKNTESRASKIKICGLFRREDIDYVNKYKPDYIGFIFWKKSHRYVDREKAAELKSVLDKDIKAVGVFVDEKAEVILDLAGEGIIDAIQLHGSEDEAFIKHIKEQSGLPVIKAVKIVTGNEVSLYDKSDADYLLLDAGKGEGKTFDWKAAQRPDKPFFIAGGINQDNLMEAIDFFKPYCVDLSSSVETERVKDEEKIRLIMQQL